ncbi:MAG: dethiobiotin synthase, partial [Thaumarchaeota archaeon]|nr:dethiobiotin synthase [Nitrososphaerota archaeon]
MVLVEGIGGIMTPITRDFFVADMIKQMGLETIVVTRSTLGTINHTVMTIEMCRKYEIPVKGLVINYFDENGTPAERNAPSTLHEVTGLPILGTIPFVRDYQKPEVMAGIVEKNIDLNALIS